MLKLPKNTLFCKKEPYYFQNPEEVTRDQVKDIFQEYQLAVGDLVNIRRRVMHRGIGGVLTQVVSITGFVFGVEYRVDHFIRQINERPNLKGR